MKKLSVLFALLAVAMMAKAEVPVISANPFTIEPGGTANLVITTNIDLTGYAAYQFDLYLPEGISLSDKYEDEDIESDIMVASGKGKHVLDYSDQSDGAIRFICYSTQNKMLLEGNEIMTLEVVAAENISEGEHKAQLKNLIFASSGDESGVSASGDKPENSEFTITVGGAGLSIDLKITSAKYSTLILPFDADLPEGLTASTVTWPETGNELVETPVTDGKLVAGVPYLMYGEEVKTYTFTGTPTYTAETGTKDALVGVLAESTVPVGCYVLQNHDGNVAFYKVATERAFHANRCYLTAKAAGALMYRIGGTTNIEEITVDENADVYDVLGRKVIGPLQKGVYIKDGRKIYVK